MKFQKYEALEKHLAEAHSEHLSSIYLISCPREPERKRLVAQVAETIRKKTGKSLIKRSEELDAALAFVRAPSLFGERLIASSEVAKDQGALITAYARAPSKGAHLILGIEQPKLAAELYQLSMREILLLDLSAESLGDRRHRLTHWAAQRFAPKKIAPALVEMLVERCDLELGLLEQEVEKLLCFTADRSEITKADLEAISISSSSQINGFQLAERLIEGTFQPPYRIDDVSALLSLIGQLRYLFESGLKLTSQLERGERPYDRNLNLVRRRPPAFFQNALRALFQLELGAKRSLGTPQLLFDKFWAQL